MDTGVIRVVELKGKLSSATLTAAVKIAIPERAVVEGLVADPGLVAEALGELWRINKLSRSDIVLGVSNHGVMMRLAAFPKIVEKKLAQTISFQAGEYFPIPLAKMVFDFSVIGESTGESGPVLDVLLVAARRDLLEKSLGALNQVNLKPIVIDPSALALMRTIPKNKLSGTVVLADISNGLSLLMMVTGGVPHIARVIPHSLQTYARESELPLTEILRDTAQQVAVTKEEGQGQFWGFETAYRWGMALAGEIRSTIGYHLSQRSEGAVDLIVISGGGVKIPGLPALLEEELGIPVEVNNPLGEISGSSQTGGIDMSKEGPEFAVSFGLALRGLEN